MEIPAPVMTTEMLPFWEGLKKEQFLLLRCKQCKEWRWPYGGCRTHPNGPYLNNMEWAQASGCGKVFTYTITNRAFHPAFEAVVPYAYAIIELDEGPVMPSNVINCNTEDIYIGMPVEVEIRKLNEEVNYPVFKPKKDE